MYALSTDELLDFCSAETQRWRDWFKANAGTLDLPIDIAQAKTVRELVLHILAVELRYAERLLEEAVTEYDQLPTATVDELFAAAERSANKLRQFMKSADEAEWKKIMTFPTRSAGTLSASKRKIFAHALLHGMRHWAQLATFLRQKGHKQPWPHDLIFSDVLS
jgi:uncharacterized damage-inducible protein DinB